MINNIELLKPEDKLFMLFNTQSFSLSTKATIEFYRNSWIKEIETKLSSKAILDEEDRSVKVWSRIISCADELSVPKEVSVRLVKFFKDLKNLPSETKEQIVELIYIFGNELKFLLEETKRGMNKPEYINMQIHNFFTVAIGNKLSAYEIMDKRQTGCRPNDENQYQFYSKELRHLFEELMFDTSDDYSAFIIYMISQYLNNSHPYFFNILVDSKSALFNNGAYEMRNTVEKLLNGDISAMTIIDSIKDTKVSTWSSDIIDTGKKYISYNYEKDKVCDRINHGGLVIGDNVLPENMLLNELVIELDKLSEDHIKDYVGEESMIDFSTTEKQTGYLKVRENVPVTKILMPEGRFYTLIKYDDETYLLFTLYGKKELFGISFPAGFKGIRKIVLFDIPDSLDYKLEIE